MPIRIIAAILGVFAMVCTFILVLVLSGHLSVDDPTIIVTVTGFAGLILTNLLSSPHNQIKRVDEKVDKVLNGVMDKKIYDQTTKALEDKGVTTDS